MSWKELGFKAWCAGLLTRGALAPSGARACSEQLTKIGQRGRRFLALFYTLSFFLVIPRRCKLLYSISQHLRIGCYPSWCILMLYGSIQPYNTFLSSQRSSGSLVEGLVEGYLDNSAISKCYPQAKGLLNRAAKACPGLLLMRLNKSWCRFITGNSVPFFAEAKTKLVLITARSETASKASLILIKPDLFYSVTMRAGKVCVNFSKCDRPARGSIAPQDMSSGASLFLESQQPMYFPRQISLGWNCFLLGLSLDIHHQQDSYD